MEVRERGKWTLLARRRRRAASAAGRLTTVRTTTTSRRSSSWRAFPTRRGPTPSIPCWRYPRLRRRSWRPASEWELPGATQVLTEPPPTRRPTCSPDGTPDLPDSDLTSAAPSSSARPRDGTIPAPALALEHPTGSRRRPRTRGRPHLGHRPRRPPTSPRHRPRPDTDLARTPTPPGTDLDPTPTSPRHRPGDRPRTRTPISLRTPISPRTSDSCPTSLPVVTPRQGDPSRRPAPTASPAPAPAPAPAGPAPKPPLPRVMAVANQKGGVGKTTTAVNLGAALAELGYRVLVVDLDPQGNATTGPGRQRPQPRSPRSTTSSCGDLPLEDCIEPTAVRNLFVAPATIDLAGAEIELVPAFSRELRLRRAIERMDGRLRLHPHRLPARRSACSPSTAWPRPPRSSCPIQCEYYALEGLGQLLRNVAARAAQPQPPPRAVARSSSPCTTPAPSWPSRWPRRCASTSAPRCAATSSPARSASPRRRRSASPSSCSTPPPGAPSPTGSWPRR